MYTRVENDTVNVTVLEFESGPMAYLGTNWACPGVFSINVYGTTADLFYQLDFSWWSNSDVTDAHSSLTKRAFARATDDPDDFELRDAEVEIPGVDHLRDEVEEFARAVRGETAAEVDAAGRDPQRRRDAGRGALEPRRQDRRRCRASRARRERWP